MSSSETSSPETSSPETSSPETSSSAMSSPAMSSSETDDGSTTYMFGCDTPDFAIVLLIELERRGFDVSVDVDRNLLYVSPVGDLTARDMSGIRRYKTHLVRLVSNCLAIPLGVHTVNTIRSWEGAKVSPEKAVDPLQPDLIGINLIEPSEAT